MSKTNCNPPRSKLDNRETYPQVHATEGQQVASKAQADGARKCGKMASLGASGRFQQNVERDLFRHARRELKVPWQLCYIDTLHRDSLRTTTARHPILPPHEVLGLVWKKSRDVFDLVFGTADLEGFWEKMFRSEPLHLQEHPARSDILKNPRFHIPCKIFDDDGSCGKYRSIKVVHWTPICSKISLTRLCKIPIFLCHGFQSIPEVTENPLFEWTVWSFDAALAGTYPQVGFGGAPLTGKRLAMAGQQIAGPYKLVFLEFMSDMAASVKTFHLCQGYNFSEKCHVCFAHHGGECDFRDFRNDATWMSRPRSNDAYLASESARRSPLSQLPGFTVHCIFPELMHAGPQGVHQTTSGSALLELCRSSCFGKYSFVGKWKDRLNLQLAEAHVSFKTYCRSVRVSSSQPLFRVGHLKMREKNSVPTLKARKAHDSLLIADWLASYCRDHGHLKSANEYVRCRAILLQGLSDMFQVFRQAGTWMTQEELRRLQRARDAFFFMSSKMNALSRESGSNMYRLLPKHHAMAHAARNAFVTARNQKTMWTFADEDMMGFVGKIAAASHGKTLVRASLVKWLMQFFTEFMDF